MIAMNSKKEAKDTGIMRKELKNYIEDMAYGRLVCEYNDAFEEDYEIMVTEDD